MSETQLLTFLGAAALKGSAILLAAALVNSFWRSASAAARHLVWTVGIASALTLPLLSAVIDRIGAPRLEIQAWAPPPAAVAPLKTAVTTGRNDGIVASAVNSPVIDGT